MRAKWYGDAPASRAMVSRERRSATWSRMKRWARPICERWNWVWRALRFRGMSQFITFREVRACLKLLFGEGKTSASVCRLRLGFEVVGCPPERWALQRQQQRHRRGIYPGNADGIDQSSLVRG